MNNFSEQYNTMDSIAEQLVAIEKDAKTKALQIGVFAVATLFSLGLIWLCFFFPIFVYFIVLAIAVLYFVAFKCASKLNVEFEYSVTNGEVDIDMITAKSTRKRMVSFSAKNIESTRFVKNSSFKDVSFVCCNTNCEYFIVTARDDSGSLKRIAMAPNQKVIDAIKKFMPYLTKSAAFNKE